MNLDFAITKPCVTLTYTDSAGTVKAVKYIYSSNVRNVEADPDYVYFDIKEWQSKEVGMQIKISDITTYSNLGSVTSVPDGITIASHVNAQFIINQNQT